jgi:hypothetical protein
MWSPDGGPWGQPATRRSLLKHSEITERGNEIDTCDNNTEKFILFVYWGRNTVFHLSMYIHQLTCILCSFEYITDLVVHLFQIKTFLSYVNPLF